MPRPPLGLYIHLPWCLHRCTYCDFNAHALRGELPETEYVRALDSDLALDAPAAAGRAIETVFIGGGTPSLFSPDAIGRILEAVDQRVPLARGAEITLEANPGSTEHAAWSGFREAGVNRLSLGVQSFGDRALRRLGRIHDAATARAAVDAALVVDFRSVNLDLMYALPGQSLDEAVHDVELAVATGVSHISHYQLTVEPGTPLASDVPGDLPGDDARADIEEACLERLAAHGFGRYEISAHGRPGHACEHNLGYWQYADYIGVGAGAHGKLTGDTGEVVRTRRVRSPRLWMASAGTPAGVSERLPVPEAERPFEVFMNGLRLADGIDPARAEAWASLPAGRLRTVAAGALADGWLEERAGRIRATAAGWRFLDSVLAEFVNASGA